MTGSRKTFKAICMRGMKTTEPAASRHRSQRCLTLTPEMYPVSYPYLNIQAPRQCRFFGSIKRICSYRKPPKAAKPVMATAMGLVLTMALAALIMYAVSDAY